MIGTVVLVAIIAACPAAAGGGPENVFLVVNSASERSMTVANHYVALREIPPGNVFYVPWKPSGSTTKPEKFRNELLLPILGQIDKRRLSGQIDQIVYSTDFPCRIDYAGAFPDVKLPKALRPQVSVTGATYLYALSANHRHEIFSLTSNYYANLPKAGVSRSQAFISKQLWKPGGQRGHDQGMRYLLCTMLGVTQGDGGSSQAEVVDYLTKAAAADATRPEGTFYYMSNGDLRTRVRLPTYAAAVAELKKLGVKAVVMKGRVPTKRSDVLGLTTGTPTLTLDASQVKIVPGALVDNFTSYGGSFHLPKNRRGQSLLNEALHRGAAGATGTIAEPTANPFKFPLSTLHVHYVRGCSMAESFYQCIQAPYQLLVVGDPLCQPWAVRATVQTANALEGSVHGIVEFQPQVRYQSASPKLASGPRHARHFELFVDGRRKQAVRAGSALKWDTTKFEDGYHRVVVVAVEDSPIRTQSRATYEVLVDNGGETIELNSLGQRANMVEVQVVSSGSEDVLLLHNQRELGRIIGGKGSLELETHKLGSGPVTIEAVSLGEKPVRARPLRLPIR